MKLDPFKLERYYTLNEFTAEYSICNSDCEAMTIKELLAMEPGAGEKFQELWLGYTETPGDPELRRDIAHIYDKVTPDQMLVCTGAQEPIFLFSQAVLESGEEVIVQTPCYQSLASIPKSIGCTVKKWELEYIDGKPYYDVDKLKSMVSNKTKVLYLNTPHNPTGFHFTKEQQNAIVDIAREHDIIVFCDEVYRELEHDIALRIPSIADAYERGVAVGVMSKSYGLPGLRIGWVTSQDHTIIEQIAVLKEYTTICNSAPSEFLAGVALRNRDKLVQRSLEFININLKLYDVFFKQNADLFSWYRPKAGPIGFVKMLFDTNDKIFAEHVLQKEGILILPGHIYDYPGYFRIGFARRNLPEALEQFEKYIDKRFRS